MSGIIVFLESDPFGTGDLFFSRARDLGLRPILLSTKPERYESLAAFENVSLSAMSESAVLGAIDRLGCDRVRGIWSVRSRLAGLAARVSRTVGRQGADPESVKLCLDKFKTRLALADAGLNDVRFMLVRSGEEAAAAARALGGRVVIKPRSMTGSFGVRLCCGPEEAQRYFDALAERVPSLRRSGALIEVAVGGRQFSVQIFDGRAIGVTRQDVGPAPHFLTLGLDFPWSDDKRVHSEIVEHAERALAAVGHRRGPGSIDIRYGKDRPRIIEINPRLASEMIAENIRLATGIDVVEATIRFACGIPYELTPSCNRGSATRWLVRPDSPVSDVVGRNRAASIAGVVHVRFFPQWFGRRGPAKNYRDRVAFVMAEAGSAAKAGEIAESSLRQLKIKPIRRVKKSTFVSGRNIASQARRFIVNLIQRSRLSTAMPRAPLLNYSIISDELSLDALQSEWESLFRRAIEQTPFLRYSWLRLCWDRQRHIPGAELSIIVLRKHDRPVLIAPFVRRGHTLSFLDSVTPQYNDVLVENSADAPTYIRYLWETLGSTAGVQHLVSKWVRDDSPLAQYLEAAARESDVASYRAPFIDISEFDGWEDYLRSLSRKFRRDHERRLRNLEKRGVVEFRVANSKTFSDDMAWLFAQKRQWLDDKGKSSKWLKAPGTEELFTAAAREGLDSGRTWVHALSVNGETIAADLSFREGSTLYMSKGAYDPSWKTYSPGRTMDLWTIQRAFEEGIKKCDYLIGRGSLKEKLATDMIRVKSRKIRLHRP